MTTIRSPLLCLILGALCYYAALPPLNIALLALAVPICWGIVIRRQTTDGDRTNEKKSKTTFCRLPSLCSRLSVAVYLTAFLFWLASIWWIACPHPLTSLGLLALSAYLSLYWLLFFVSARVAVHHFHIPLLVAMPVCWIGCEYLRCRILGGFSFCALEHALYLYPSLIQFAAIGGSTFVGGIIMLIGAACVTCFHIPQLHCKVGYVVFVLVPLLLCFPLIGIVRMSENSIGTHYSAVALQGNKPVRLNPEPGAADETFRQFIDLIYQTVNERTQAGRGKPDVFIFPETVCPIPVLAFEGTVTPADVGLTDEEAADWERWLRGFVQQIDTSMIFGLSTFVFQDDPDKPRRLNSALLVQPQRGEELGKVLRYDKMHLVMFGEYIPFADYLPDNFILRTLCPEAHHGNTPVVFPIGQGSDVVEASMSICFESSVSHLIRRQVLTLRKQGRDPRVLVNLSNVGWFWFSQQIEQHLATHVFRAVENRMWYVTATNGGFSATISPYGKIQAIGKRGAAESVAGTVSVNLNEAPPTTIYHIIGDWYALPCAVVVLVLAGVGFHRTRRDRLMPPFRF